MQIVSIIFFAFLAVVFSLLYVCNRLIKDADKKISVIKWILLVASYIFVIYADYRFAVILFVISFCAYFVAKKGRYYAIGIIIPILALGYFKYTNFFIESFANLLGKDYTLLNLILPLGISFYSFSAISYMVDVKRGKIEPRSFKDVVLYVSYFPKITSGPIQRSSDFFNEVDKELNIGWSSFLPGIQIFAFGLFKKIVVADRLSVFVNQVYDAPLAFSSLTVFLATLAYSLQIYFDFSGYSDMAIGVSKIIGINLPRNFNLPYLSRNVTELWKRWHISLSSWLQEYLYISLGGSRKGKIRTYVNLVLTMVIGGIWHGANWTYIIWGLLHGVALAVHKVWMLITKSPDKKHGAVSNVVSIVVTFLFVNFCWIFFRAPSFDVAMTIIGRMVSFDVGITQIYAWFIFAAIVYIIGMTCAVVKSKREGLVSRKQNMCPVEGYYPLMDLTKFTSQVVFFVFLGLIIALAYTGGSPFIYGNY